MPRSIKLAMLAAACTAACALAQDSPAPAATAQSASAPVAYIYVSNVTNPTGYPSKYNIYAFAAASNGKLTHVSGSPFKGNVSDMAVNGKYLFGNDGNGITIDTFSMASNGALKQIHTFSPGTYNPGGCGGYYGPIRFDHSGQFLYNASLNPDCYATFQTLRVEKSTGKLDYVSTNPDESVSYGQLDFSGNNRFAYTNVCTVYDHESVGYLTGFERVNDGSLVSIALSDVMPQTTNGGTIYCPMQLANDPTHHMAALLQEVDFSGDAVGNPVLATFTVNDTTGDLTTKSTPQNMPQVSAGTYWMRMSPSGKILAIGGSVGLELFHFNGSSTPTKYKTILSSHTVSQFYWDNDNHLYVIASTSKDHGKLYVYTITTTSVTEASGSPYSIPNPAQMIVQPK